MKPYCYCTKNKGMTTWAVENKINKHPPNKVIKIRLKMTFLLKKKYDFAITNVKYVEMFLCNVLKRKEA